MDLRKTTYLNGANAPFLADLYERFLKDPNTVDPSWRAFFGELGEDARAALTDLTGASWHPRDTHVIGNGQPPRPNGGNGAALGTSQEAMRVMADAGAIRAAALDSIRALILIRSYRVRGHLYATLDPLGIEGRHHHAELDYRTYGFSEADLDRSIFINHYLGLGEIATLREIVDRCRATYSGNIGVEFMHNMEPAIKAWIQERIEAIENRTEFTPNGRRAILERLTAAETFERFLDKKYTGTKRFGLDGGESTIPALEQIIKRGGQLGLREIVIGMPHRGRLNVLANVMGKPFQAIFSEFQGNATNPDDVQGSGDVKYHLGTSSDREFDGNNVHLSLTANPSHLEAVDPVVCGKVRAKQTQRAQGGPLDRAREQVMGLLLHGDAAFAGQGLVAETFDLSELKGYRTGGTIHFIVNNQIGFTTNPVHSRSGPYCSEIAKIVQAPIFHVNGDDPEAVVHVARIATEYRWEFQRDVVIDMFCYRRHGHNEGDEPSFTQPLMYQRIKEQPTTRAIYAGKLIEEGVVTGDEAGRFVADYEQRLDEAFQASDGFKANKADWLEGAWTGLEPARSEYIRGDTAVPLDRLRAIGDRLADVPEGFHVNRKIKRQLDHRRKIVAGGEGIDWALGEALAFGTLLVEGTPVRLSGQDSGRGTFSQRHAVLVDQENEERYVPLQNLSDDQAMFEIIDSPLAEASVLGFEYGYSLAEPYALVAWEAQFGDFSNGAQIIIDQFISSGESKWLRMSGLVMLLPHGYEGQGPEHSSARLERYLQLCAEDNMQVVNCTAPANYFHVLRRQMRRKYRKPLVIMTPKSLLRHKAAVSRLDDFGPGSSFHRVLMDGSGIGPDAGIERVVVCSGKVYYDLIEARDARQLNDRVCILRMEQLYPFPAQPLADDLSRFPRAEVVWCQEEPENMGAWWFVDRRIEQVMRDLGMAHERPRYVGRPAAASPATGLYARHLEQQNALVDAALALDAKPKARKARAATARAKG
jgi:2-oxoglutarate dehydrogenase E1 component